eukprot:TRINITY_DN12032_c0_g3_i1.p1 TRINITY_DN12032_c0_g3~~TRINITY_DN12032_c0_g3_i1.p1  ORF type:complete len:247 (+),score=47.83 TRINITY_DN12032_c0_g3_i1:137-877(+)
MSHKLISKIDNLVEVKEEPYNFLAVIKQRNNMLGSFKGLGPPDLCYLVREEKGTFFSTHKKAGFFHYVYGVDTSSPATIFEYVKSTVAQGPCEYFCPHPSLLSLKSAITVTKAYFSVYNHFRSSDTRLEMNFPGSLSAYSLSRYSSGMSTERINWEETYVSSVLRSFAPLVDVSVRVLPELLTHSQLENFLKCAAALIKRNTRLSKANDIIKTTHNTLAGKVMSYLLKKCYFEDCKAFFEERTLAL